MPKETQEEKDARELAATEERQRNIRKARRTAFLAAIPPAKPPGAKGLAHAQVIQPRRTPKYSDEKEKGKNK